MTDKWVQQPVCQTGEVSRSMYDFVKNRPRKSHLIAVKLIILKTIVYIYIMYVIVSLTSNIKMKATE